MHQGGNPTLAPRNEMQPQMIHLYELVHAFCLIRDFSLCCLPSSIPVDRSCFIPEPVMVKVFLTPLSYCLATFPPYRYCYETTKDFLTSEARMFTACNAVPLSTRKVSIRRRRVRSISNGPSCPAPLGWRITCVRPRAHLAYRVLRSA